MKKVFHAIGKLITNQEKSKSGLQIILVQSVEHRYMYMKLFQNKQISSTNSPIKLHQLFLVLFEHIYERTDYRNVFHCRFH